MKKCSLFDVQRSVVSDGGASRIVFLINAAPQAHPKMTIER
jgi:hypothetical protein